MARPRPVPSTSREFNQYIDYGKVFSQSINASTKITRNDPVTVNISRGVSATNNGVLIKDFNDATLEDLKFWCDKNEVPYVVTDCYSDTETNVRYL